MRPHGDSHLCSDACIGQWVSGTCDCHRRAFEDGRSSPRQLWGRSVTAGLSCAQPTRARRHCASVRATTLDLTKQQHISVSNAAPTFGRDSVLTGLRGAASGALQALLCGPRACAARSRRRRDGRGSARPHRRTQYVGTCRCCCMRRANTLVGWRGPKRLLWKSSKPRSGLPGLTLQLLIDDRSVAPGPRTVLAA